VDVPDTCVGNTIYLPVHLEGGHYIMTVGSARPMEDAARIAYSEFVKWLSTDYGKRASPVGRCTFV
jgi:amidase